MKRIDWVALAFVVGVVIGALVVGLANDMANKAASEPAKPVLASATVLMDGTGSMTTRIGEVGTLTRFDIAKLIALTLASEKRVAPYFSVFGNGISEDYNYYYVRPIAADELAKFDQWTDFSPGATSFEIPLRWEIRPGAVVLITDAESAGPPMLSIDTMLRFKKEGMRLILVVVGYERDSNSLKGSFTSFPELELFVRETNGAVIFADPMNLGKTVNDIYAALGVK